MGQDFKELYDCLYDVAKAEIVPTYAGRVPEHLFAPLDYLESPDGRIEQILRSYLDADRTAYDYTGSEIDQAITAGKVIARRLEKLRGDVKVLESLIVSEQAQMSSIFEQVLNSESLSEELKAKGESIKAIIRKHKWLRTLLADYEQILIQDTKNQLDTLKSDYKQKLAKRLIKARNVQNLTIDDTANLIGITRTGYNKYEIGLSEPTAFAIGKLCKVLNVSADYLLGLSQ